VKNKHIPRLNKKRDELFLKYQKLFVKVVSGTSGIWSKKRGRIEWNY
jgi:cytoskeletal protein RodZ